MEWKTFEMSFPFLGLPNTQRFNFSNSRARRILSGLYLDGNGEVEGNFLAHLGFEIKFSSVVDLYDMAAGK